MSSLNPCKQALCTVKQMLPAPLVFAQGVLVLLTIWLGFPNDFVNAPLLALFWPVLVAHLGMTATAARFAFLRGYLSTLAGMICALYWLALPITNVGGLPIALAALCALCVAACLALQGGIFALALFYLRNTPTVARALFAASFWALLEFLCAAVAGFPWLPIAGALVVEPAFVQLAQFVGSYGVCALYLFGLFLLLTKKATRLFGGLVLLSLFVLNVSLLPEERESTSPNSLAVLFVEGNVDQNQKWVPSLQRATVARYIALTNEGLLRNPNTKPLIIWPETALPFFFETNHRLANQVRAAVATFSCPLLFGAPGTDPEQPPKKRPIFNRATLLNAQGETIGVYDKEHLVPFGEYTPAFLHFSFLDPLLQGVGIYTEGVNTAPLRLRESILGLLICYEGIFPWLAQERVAQGANILVDISNDGWFLKTPASRQHLYLTCLRAIEQQRAILRGTNSGISAVIDPFGRIVMQGPLFHAGTLFAHAPLCTQRTLYHQTATAQTILLVLLPCVLGLWLFKKRGKTAP